MFALKDFFPTNTVLIPKEEGAKITNDFRPIGLMSSINEIITKILAEKIRKL
jgi:hypothetical protein